MSDAYPNANHFIGSSALDGDEASIAANIAAMDARVEQRQAESAQFIIEHGAAVLDGHTPVMTVPRGD
jgi:hypothetical protein